MQRFSILIKSDTLGQLRTGGGRESVQVHVGLVGPGCGFLRIYDHLSTENSQTHTFDQHVKKRFVVEILKSGAEGFLYLKFSNFDAFEKDQ